MIGGLSPWHILLIVIALAVLFGGRGKLSGIMGDAAKGVRAFKDGLKEDGEPGAAPSTVTPAAPPAAVAHDALAEAQAREQALREELARQTAAREAAEARARQSAV